MKKNRLTSKLLYILMLPLLVAACDDDDEGGNSVDFASIGSGYAESEGETTVTVPFRNGGSIALSDLAFDGSATEGEDYEIVGVTAEGVQLTLLDETKPEHLETIRIMIKEGKGNAIHTVTISSDDPGFVEIDMDWTGDADMDLYLLYKAKEEDDFEQIAFSDPGHIVLDWTDPDGIYALSYNYYDGEADPLNFTGSFTPTGMSVEGSADPLTFHATYTLDNIDPAHYQIEQTFVKEGLELKEFSEIDVPSEGSRKRSFEIKEAIARIKANK